MTWKSHLPIVAFLIIAIVGCGRPQQIDVSAFDRLYEAGRAVQTATEATPVDIRPMQGLVASFVKEWSTLGERAGMAEKPKADPDRRLFLIYGAAAAAYADSLVIATQALPTDHWASSDALTEAQVKYLDLRVPTTGFLPNPDEWRAVVVSDLLIVWDVANRRLSAANDVYRGVLDVKSAADLAFADYHSFRPDLDISDVSESNRERVSKEAARLKQRAQELNDRLPEIKGRP